MAFQLQNTAGRAKAVELTNSLCYSILAVNAVIAVAVFVFSFLKKVLRADTLSYFPLLSAALIIDDSLLTQRRCHQWKSLYGDFSETSDKLHTAAGNTLLYASL